MIRANPSRSPRAFLGTLLLLALSAPAAAQIDWVTFHEDNSKLIAKDSFGFSDNQEKDFAWGDLDKDGWTDLVIVRKKPFTNSGARYNVLLMNEGGVLRNRTKGFATGSDVVGDKGFKTFTNDRDVVIGDVNMDGWLDVVTATTISPGKPKHESHPRVYINLGNDANGDWLGLRFEDARIPDFGTFPNFCGVGIGDVTGDGAPDLYFAHYHQAADVDLDDRLLINDGNGFFSDESAARMTSDMLESSFGTAAVIDDFNGDGHADVVKDTALGQTGGGGPRVNVSYNDSSNVGFFDILQTAYTGSPYHVNAGDLNQDGRPDLIVADDGSDRYLLNTGNDALGRVIWSAAHTYNVDDGFGSNNLVADIDGDGWGDVLIADVDVDISGCGRRMHIFHNQGGQVGGFVDLNEESGGGWTAIAGITANDLRGTHDVAVFDLDNDGDQDMVIGRCVGTRVWINDQIDGQPIGSNYCGPAVDNSTGQPALISAFGSTDVADNLVTLTATQLPPNQVGYFLTSTTQGFTANPGGSQGNLCLGGQIGRYSDNVLFSGQDGEFGLAIDLTDMPPLGTAVQPGETWNFTTWYRDMNPGNTSNFTDGLQVDFQ